MAGQAPGELVAAPVCADTLAGANAARTAAGGCARAGAGSL
jgi:hypothetical protein